MKRPTKLETSSSRKTSKEFHVTPMLSELKTSFQVSKSIAFATTRTFITSTTIGERELRDSIESTFMPLECFSKKSKPMREKSRCRLSRDLLRSRPIPRLLLLPMLRLLLRPRLMKMLHSLPLRLIELLKRRQLVLLN